MNVALGKLTSKADPPSGPAGAASARRTSKTTPQGGEAPAFRETLGKTLSPRAPKESVPAPASGKASHRTAETLKSDTRRDGARGGAASAGAKSRASVSDLVPPDRPVAGERPVRRAAAPAPGQTPPAATTKAPAPVPLVADKGHTSPHTLPNASGARSVPVPDDTPTAPTEIPQADAKTHRIARPESAPAHRPRPLPRGASRHDPTTADDSAGAKRPTAREAVRVGPSDPERIPPAGERRSVAESEPGTPPRGPKAPPQALPLKEPAAAADGPPRQTQIGAEGEPAARSGEERPVAAGRPAPGMAAPETPARQDTGKPSAGRKPGRPGQTPGPALPSDARDEVPASSADRHIETLEPRDVAAAAAALRGAGPPAAAPPSREDGKPLGQAVPRDEGLAPARPAAVSQHRPDAIRGETVGTAPHEATSPPAVPVGPAARREAEPTPPSARLIAAGETLPPREPRGRSSADEPTRTVAVATGRSPAPGRNAAPPLAEETTPGKQSGAARFGPEPQGRSSGRPEAEAGPPAPPRSAVAGAGRSGDGAAPGLPRSIRHAPERIEVRAPESDAGSNRRTRVGAEPPRVEPPRVEPPADTPRRSTNDMFRARAIGAAEGGARVRTTASFPAAVAPPAGAAPAVRRGRGGAEAPKAEAREGAPVVRSPYGPEPAAAAPPSVRRLAQAALPLVTGEVVRQARLIRRRGRTEVRIQLHPPELGRMRLEIAQVSGRLEVRLRIEDPGLRDALRADLRQLERSLRDSDVDLSRMDVSDFGAGRRDGGRGLLPEGEAAPSPPTGGGADSRPTASEAEERTWTIISENGEVDCFV